MRLGVVFVSETTKICIMKQSSIVVNSTYLYNLCAAYRRLRQTFLKAIAFEILYNNDKDRLIQENESFIFQFNQNEIHLRTNGQCNILTIV